jgi:hypothetical protein
MILDDQGNVGIGTASPDARLDVFATANAAVLDVVKAGGAGPIFRVFKDSPKTDDQLVLTITRDQGYMGLGVVAPQQRLDVAGTVKAAAFQGDGSGLSSISAAAIADGAISARTIQNWAVTASAIADGAVQTTKIADGQVTAQKLSPAVTNALVPVGTVVAFAGGTPPDGWWICDGRPVSRDDYRSLWLVIGPSWGAGNGNSTFNIPDLRGLFLRGVDHSQWMPDENPPRDPDRNSRTNLQGVTLGNAVGSYQADGFKSHTHSQIGGPTTQILANGSNISIPHNTESPTGATGGSESRPKNAYVNYIIKY